MMKEVKNVFKKYAVFDGRSSRREFWYFFLFNFIVSIVQSTVLMGLTALSISGGAELGGVLLGIVSFILLLYDLGAIIPSFAVTFRRLHDAGKSGAYYFIGLVPLVGSIILLIALAEQGDPGDNKYGPNPYSDNPPPVKELAGQGHSGGKPPVVPPKPDGITLGNQPTVPESKALLKVICNTGALAGRTFRTENSLCIGRSKTCDIVFPDDSRSISRFHCRLTLRNGQAYLEDMASTNGTFLQNRGKLQPHVPVRISDNTRFFLGNEQTMFTAYIEIRRSDAW